MTCGFSGRTLSCPTTQHTPAVFQPKKPLHWFCGKAVGGRRLWCQAAAPPPDGPSSSGSSNNNSNNSSSNNNSSSRITQQPSLNKASSPSTSASTADVKNNKKRSATTTSSSSHTKSITPPTNEDHHQHLLLHQQQQHQSDTPATLQQPSLPPLTKHSWEWWTAYFNSMDDTVRELDGIDEELATAVEEEDYSKAAALAQHQRRLEKSDEVATILDELQRAVKEERYADAARLRDAGGAGLLGWWAGQGTDRDSSGHILHISADFGRYVAHAFTGITLAEMAGLNDDFMGPVQSRDNRNGANSSNSQLESAASLAAAIMADDNDDFSSSSTIIGGDVSGDDQHPGAAVFEVFVRKDPDSGEFMQQATALQVPASALVVDPPQKIIDELTELLSQQVGGNGATVTVERGTNEGGIGYVRINVTGVQAEDDSTEDDSTDEEVDLLEIEAIRVSSNDVEEEDDDDESIHTIDDLMASLLTHPEDDETEENAARGAVDQQNSNRPLGNTIRFHNEDKKGNKEQDSSIEEEEDSQQDMVDAWIEVDGRLKKMKLDQVVAEAIGTTYASKNNDNTTDNDNNDSTVGDTLSEMGLGAVAQRVPAVIEWEGRDKFTFVVANDLKIVESPSISEADTPGDRIATSATGDTNRKTQVMPVFSGRMEEIESIVRNAMGQATTSKTSQTANIVDQNDKDDNDVLGLSGRVNYTRLPTDDPPTDVFSGVYIGTFGPHGPEALRVARTTIEGEEWVQGTKLTGDPNVPAGKVSFRARIGVSHRLSPSGVYPPEYGVQQRYKGQGRVAREGYSAAKWVDGELLTFSAANPITRGAELGFVFNIDATRKYLLLFTKVRLDELIAKKLEQFS